MVKVTLKTDNTAFNAAMDRLKKLGGGSVKAGVFAKATTPDGDLVAPIAFYHEFGTVNIPARSFLRSTMDEQREKWARQFLGVIQGRLLQNGIIKRGLTAVGQSMKADVRDKIKSNIAPTLKPETVNAKIRAKKAVNSPDLALVQYGYLQKAIASEVKA